MPLKKLKLGIDFRCESLLQPLLELVPNQNQVSSSKITCDFPRLLNFLCTDCLRRR